MALQGDLESFALPDVLRLLAGTSKTGRLGVIGAERSGDVWFRDGQIVGGVVSSSRHATAASDVVFELLRFDEGTFAFEDGEEPTEPVDATPVDQAIEQAQDLLREWAEVEAVVPSTESWVTLTPEIEGDATTVSAHHWRLLASVAGGLTVRELGDRFEQTDLAACRSVKELVEAGLVDLGSAPEGRSEPVEASIPAAEDREPDDLSVLRADDGPVVLEASDDALLPEPLPGEGTSFEGDLADMASVDGRSFDSSDGGDPEPAPGAFDSFPAYTPSEPEPVSSYGYQGTEPPPYEPATGFEPAGDHGTSPAPEFTLEDPPAIAEAPAADDVAPTPALAPSPFDDDEQPDTFGDDFFGSPARSDAHEEVGDDPLASTPSTDAGSGAGDEGDDADRGALLNFLSSVKH